MGTTPSPDRAGMPAWVRRLLDRHPGAELPTAENPMPRWLEEELRQAPLWMHIRGSEADPRSSPPYHLIEDVRDEPDLLVRREHEALTRVPAVVSKLNAV